MAGKGDGKIRKTSNKSKLDVERFAFDILSFVLPICGLLDDKFKYRAGKQNVYRDKKYVRTAGAYVMSLALYHRDDWKTMFESRFRNSGFDTDEKIEKYLISFFSVNRDFQNADTSTKVLYTLAVYSEIMLYLNHKGIQLDLDLLLNFWSRYLTQYIAQSNTDRLLYNLFPFESAKSQYIDWIAAFIRDAASPYGNEDGVSKLYYNRLVESFDYQKVEENQMAEFLKLLGAQASAAEESEIVVEAVFDGTTFLLGDRDSPELLSSHERGAVGGNEEYGKELACSASDSECTSVGRQRSKTSSELDIDDRFQQMNLRTKRIPKSLPDNKSKKEKSRKRDSC